MVLQVLQLIAKKTNEEIKKKVKCDELSKDYIDLREDCIRITKGLMSLRSIPESTLQELETLQKRAEAIFQKLDKDSDIRNKAATTAMLVWSKSGYVERSIYLAGYYKDADIKEPYRTHIDILPAHACLFRYRQILKVSKWMEQELEGCPNSQIVDIISQMKSSYYQQFRYFSKMAWIGNKTHPLSCYHYSLSLLMDSITAFENGKEKLSEKLSIESEQILKNASYPTNDSPRAILIYHKTNFSEFKTFGRLSSRYPKIKNILEERFEKASYLLSLLNETNDNPDESKKPGIIRLIQLGGTTVSAAGSACALGYLFDLEPTAIIDSLGQLWDYVSQIIPAVGDQADNLMTFNDADFLDLVVKNDGNFLDFMKQSMNDGDFI